VQPPAYSLDVAADAQAHSPAFPNLNAAQRLISSALTLVVCAGVVAVLCFQALNFTTSWVHPETLDAYRTATSNGLSPHVTDFLDVLSLAKIDDRPRFFSDYLEILDIKLRLFLLRTLSPFPPGLSLSWIFSLVLAPLLLYRAVWNFTGDRGAALNSLLLYMVSMSSLSTIVLRFHIGKPLTSFFVISVLWGASVVHRARWESGFETRPPLIKRWHVALCFAYFTACLFFDETALFAYLVLTVMLFGFFRGRLNALRAALFAGPLIVYAAVTFVVVPSIARMLGLSTFNFLNFIFGVSLRSQFHWASFYDNFHTNFLANMVPSQLYNPSSLSVPFKMHADSIGRMPFWAVEPLFLVFYFAFFGVVARQVTARRGPFVLRAGVRRSSRSFWHSTVFLGVAAPQVTGRRGVFALRAGICVVLFVIGQTILMIRHLQVASGYYYGALFGVFYSMLVGTVLAGARGWMSVFGKLVLIMLLVIQVANFEAVERPTRAFHDRLTFEAFRGRFFNTTLEQPTSAANVFAIWHVWRSGRFADVRRWARVPVQSTWLLQEITTIENHGGGKRREREERDWTPRTYTLP